MKRGVVSQLHVWLKGFNEAGLLISISCRSFFVPGLGIPSTHICWRSNVSLHSRPSRVKEPR